MTSVESLIVVYRISFTEDMLRLLGEALMWPVAIWIVWTILQRRFRKQKAG